MQILTPARWRNSYLHPWVGMWGSEPGPAGSGAPTGIEPAEALATLDDWDISSSPEKDGEEEHMGRSAVVRGPRGPRRIRSPGTHLYPSLPEAPKSSD